MPLKWTPNPADVELAFAKQREVDPSGHRIHALLGALWCVLVSGPVSLIEFGWAPLAVCFLIRFRRHRCTHGVLKRFKLLWITLAWAAWQGASVLWSLDKDVGVQEFGALRFAIPVLLLWPVLDRRPWLIAGVAIGLLAANVSQVSHAIGTAFGVDAMTFQRLPGRNSGWWQPVVGGTMLTAGVGLHLPAALTAKGKWRLLGIFGLLVSITGVVSTGSRGAWIATGVLLFLGGVWFTRRLLGKGLAWGHLPLIFALLVVFGAVGYKSFWPGMRARTLEGVQEVRQIVESGDYSTYTGARIVMARWAVRAFEASPVWGIGAGGYRPWVARQIEREPTKWPVNPAHAHSHNTFLQVAATTGVVGLALFGAIVVLSLRGGFTRDGSEPGEVSGYEAGPVFALLGMLLVTPFDVVNVNAQTAGMWWILVALCVLGRPKSLPGAPGQAPTGQPLPHRPLEAEAMAQQPT